MKSIDVTVKGVKETTRDRRGFLFILGFPILLIVLFAFAFGSGSFLTGGSLPHNVVVVNEDVGVKVATNNTTKNINYGNNFIQVLTNATSENSSTHLFTLNNASAAKADDMLKLSLIHISEPTRRTPISYAVFCLKKKKTKITNIKKKKQ